MIRLLNMDPEQMLPGEIWIEIMKNLSLRDILNLEQINESFKRFSESDKGELIWAQKLETKFPGAYEFKTEGMSSREMYIRIARGFGLLNIDFTNVTDSTNLEQFPNHLFGKNDSDDSDNEIININPDSDIGVMDYFINWMMLLDNHDEVKSKLIYYIALYSDFETLKLILDNYDINYNEFLWYIMLNGNFALIPIDKLKYTLRQIEFDESISAPLEGYIIYGHFGGQDYHVPFDELPNNIQDILDKFLLSRGTVDSDDNDDLNSDDDSYDN